MADASWTARSSWPRKRQTAPCHKAGAVRSLRLRASGPWLGAGETEPDHHVRIEPCRRHRLGYGVFQSPPATPPRPDLGPMARRIVAVGRATDN